MFSFLKRKPRGPEIWDYPDLDALCRSGAAFVRGIARLAVKQRGVFRLCVSAAPNVLALCQMLPRGTRQSALEWDAMHLFFAWERRDDANPDGEALGRTRLSLLDTTPLREKNVHSIAVKKGIENAVALYEQDLERHFQMSVSSVSSVSSASALSPTPPPWDMLILDVNADGGLGGLLPGDPALDAPARWVAPLRGGAVGLTLRALEGAANALLLATGEEARSIVAQARTPDETFRTLPAGGFSPAGRRVWLTDSEA